VGPGGILRALRAVPVYQGFAEAIARHCPGAWVINYTNPMTVLTRTLNKVQPRLKVFGCCHEVFGTQGWLAGLAARRFKVPAPSRREIKINVLGINHFTWFSKAVWKGHDLLALARREMGRHGVRRKYTEQEILRQLEKAGHAPWSVNNHEITYELFSRYGLLPAAGDRHLAEFVPGFLESRRSIYRWGIAPTGVPFRLNMVKERVRKMRERVRSNNRVLTPSGEEGVAIMKSLLGLSKLRTNVNFPNQGQIANLPRHAVVETLADFSGSGVKPIDAGPLPAGVLGQVLPHVLNQELVVEAALRLDLGLAFQAFLNDPLMTLAPDRARELFDKMVKATRPWLRGYK
jgi:alpha-galactosidase